MNKQSSAIITLVRYKPSGPATRGKAHEVLATCIATLARMKIIDKVRASN